MIPRKGRVVLRYSVKDVYDPTDSERTGTLAEASPPRLFQSPFPC